MRTRAGFQKGDLKTLILAALVVVLFFVPAFVKESYVMHIFILTLMFGAASLSYDLLFGYAGQLNLGPAGFFGLGAYTSALLAMRLGVSPYLGLLAGASLAGLFGFVVSVPCLRLRGLSYVAIMTWGFAEILRVVCANWVDLTRGYLVLWGIPPFAPIQIGSMHVEFTAERWAPYYLMLGLLMAIAIVSYAIIRSKFGKFLIAIREDEDAAEALGVDVTKYKVLIFTLSSFLTGLVGGFYAHYIQVLSPDVMSLNVSTQIIVYQVVGGSSTLVGPIIGSFVLTFLAEYLRIAGQLRMVLYGILIIVTIMFQPAGLVGLLRAVASFLTKTSRKAFSSRISIAHHSQQLSSGDSVEVSSVTG